MTAPLPAHNPPRSALWPSGLLLALLLSLTACGGGGGGTSESTGGDGGGATNTPVPTAWAQAVATGDVGTQDAATALEQTGNLLKQLLADEAAVRQAVLGTPVGANGARATAAAAAATGITWDPSHDSAYFTLLDQSRHRVLLSGNWRFKGTDPATGRVLAVAGTDPATGARYAAFGGNPLAVRGNAAMDTVMKNTVGWLTGRSSLSGLKVVTAHLPGSATYWFPHEAPTRAWLTAQLPSVSINGVVGAASADDRCDGSALDACLQGADLLVIGRQETPNSGTSTYHGSSVMAAVKAAQARGVPVLYLHHDGDAGDLATRMLDHLGLAIGDNYWAEEGLNAFDPAAQPANALATDTLALLQRLQAGHFSTTFSGCVSDVGKVVCDGDAALQSEFNTPAKAVRAALRALDAKGLALFDQPGYALEKHLVLLGDTWRKAVTYPMDKGGDKGAFFRAQFSDMTAYINRRHSATAAHQGSFAPAIPAATPAVARTVTTTAPATGTREFMTGLYAMPGRTVTLTRNDAATASVTIGINLLRDTTRVYNANGYDRPTMLASPRVPLVKGQTVTLTSPFGGPLYLFVGSASGAPAISVAVDGVITHPVLRDMRDAAQVAAFKAELASTPTNWVGITSDFLTVHSNVPHMRSTLAAHGGDMGLLADRIGTYMVQDTYELAGFNSASGGFSLPASVSAFCSTAGWDCTGPQHRRDVMQHVIADTVAACGAGCSGNPYDQNWALEPLGWGETHEIGHNLQRARLKIYGGQSTEVSNNIFPMHKQMAFNRANPAVTPLTRSVNTTRAVFATLTLALASADPQTYMRTSIWTNTAYAANAAERLVFYRQLVEFARYYNSPAFSDGWELYTLMHLLDRNFSASEAGWAGAKDGLGFGTYAAYPSAMDGNDFMLIAASRIIGRDMRPVWALWGVTTSAAAQAQVAAYGYPAAEPLLFPMKDLNAHGSGVGAPVTLSATATYPAGY